MTGKRTGYTSVPYTSVGAFSVETVGGMLDTDSKMTMHARGIGRLSMDYAKGVDVLSIFRFLSTAVIRGKAAGEHAAAGAIVHDPASAGGWGGSTGFLDIFGSNYSQIDKCAVESRLKSNPNILLQDEKVEMAFKCGRDSFVLTSHRVLRIDVQGLSGKKGEEGCCFETPVVIILSRLSLTQGDMHLACSYDGILYDSGIYHNFVAAHQGLFE